MAKLQDELGSGQMNTLSEIMNMLTRQGYKDFTMTDLGMASKETNEIFRPGDIVIKKVHRFEGESNPEDMSVLYEIETNSGIKGMFLDAFGTYGDYDAQGVTKFFREVKREANP
jgi:hypothetical protein